MATRFDYLEARETMAERNGYRLGLAAAVNQIEELAVSRFKECEDNEAKRLRDLAFIVDQLTVPDEEEPYRHLIDNAISVLGADDSEVLQVHSYDVDEQDPESS